MKPNAPKPQRCAIYTRLGSIGELAASLDRDGIQPRPRTLANGRVIAAERFMVGPLAHILKNRFYIGEIVYRGGIHRGEHAPILDHDLFNAVQAKLTERAVQRKLTRSRSPSILAGLIFDDRGNPMSPSHANKKGVRYRYYVSQALLQSRKTEAGSRRDEPIRRQLSPAMTSRTTNSSASMSKGSWSTQIGSRSLCAARKPEVANRTLRQGRLPQ
jgi:Recombinase